MAAHEATLPDQSVGIEESDQKEEQIHTSDDQLARDLYKDYSSQNEIFKQLVLMGAALGFKETKGVRDAYAFFAKNQIDPEKLIKDPVYRAQIKEHVKRLNFWEKGAIKDGRSKLGTVLEGANKAITEVDSTNKKLTAIKEGVIKDYSIELQNLYGLSQKEIEAIIQRAKYAVRADPHLSMQDFVQREAQLIARDNIKKEVENEARAKKEELTPKQKELAIKVKTAQKKLEFDKKTQLVNNFEEENHITLTSNCKYQLDKILTTNPPAFVSPQSIPPPPPQPLPAISIPSTPVIPPSISPAAAIPIQGGFHFPGFSLPTGLTQGLGNVFGGLGLGKMFGGVGKGLSSILGKNGAFSKAFDAATKLGKMAINRGLDALLPGLGVAVGKLNDVIKRVIGIDIEGIIVKGAALLVGAVAAVAIILPLIIGIGVFSYITGNNPLKLSYSNNQSIGWDEFNKQYLTAQNNTLTLDSSATPQNDKKISWQQFAEENLTPSKQYLSLENIVK